MKSSTRRKTRDRKGGHEPSVLSVGMEGWAYCTKVERSLVKRLTKKKIRRQHKMTMAQVCYETSNDWTLEDHLEEINYGSYDADWEDYIQDREELEDDWDQYDPYYPPMILGRMTTGMMIFNNCNKG